MEENYNHVIKVRGSVWTNITGILQRTGAPEDDGGMRTLIRHYRCVSCTPAPAPNIVLSCLHSPLGSVLNKFVYETCIPSDFALGSGSNTGTMEMNLCSNVNLYHTWLSLERATKVISIWTCFLRYRNLKRSRLSSESLWIVQAHLSSYTCPAPIFGIWCPWHVDCLLEVDPFLRIFNLVLQKHILLNTDPHGFPF